MASFKGKVDADEIAPPVVGSLLEGLLAQKDEETYDDAIPWIPAGDGDGLEGEVIGIGSYHDENYGNDKLYRTWIVRDAHGGEWSVIPFHRKLRKLMTQHRAEIGDQVAILFVGEKVSPTDPEATYKEYRVARVAAARQRRMRANGDAARIMTPDAFGQKVSAE